MDHQVEKKGAPKTYSAPKLVVYGDVRAVTQNTTVTKSNDGQNNHS
jgi:hypothetical protein